MISRYTWFGIVAATVSATLLFHYYKKRNQQIPAVFFYLYFILPFAAGGFHSHVSFFTSWILFFQLVHLYRQKGFLVFKFNRNSLAVLVVAVGYAITPIWAADHGMALFGLVRSFPLLLLIAILMQYPRESHQRFMMLIPLSGAFMTVLSCSLLIFPGFKSSLTHYARLSGFLQYPNAFAAFLLGGLIIQSRNKGFKKADYFINASLILGIILSGSRTVFVLLVIALIGIILIQHQPRQMLVLGSFFVLSILLALWASRFKTLQEVTRFANIDIFDSSFLMRLLYYKDALRIIIRYPFGTGYLGYRALEGLYQTGGYSVTFVHNGLLQLLLDIGWIPSLFIAYSFGASLFSNNEAPTNRLLLMVLLAHSMLDFDLQYFLFWSILLSVLDFENGMAFSLGKRKQYTCIICACVLLFSTWLGISDYFYCMGYYKECLTIMPLHTDAMTKTLKLTKNIEESNKIADRILALNPTCSIAYSAKANAAYFSGKILNMIEYKKQAISYSRFTNSEYCDYFQKLYSAMQVYIKTGDTKSAAYCANRLLEVPTMINDVIAITDPIYVKTIKNHMLALPEEYLAFLDTLSHNLF